jgi:hypothetical protein
MGLKALQQTGASANLGQTGRSARKNMQSIMAAFGQQQALLTDTLEREGASMGLKWDKQNAQLGRVLDSTELGQRQLTESMKSANAQWESDQQNAALQKYSADLSAETSIAPEPLLPPLSPAPLKYPRPKSIGPQQPPSWEQYESVKPIKGAISKPSALQKAAGVIGTVASVASMFSFGSDDRSKACLFLASSSSCI